MVGAGGVELQPRALVVTRVCPIHTSPHECVRYTRVHTSAFGTSNRLQAAGPLHLCLRTPAARGAPARSPLPARAPAASRPALRPLPPPPYCCPYPCPYCALTPGPPPGAPHHAHAPHRARPQTPPRRNPLRRVRLVRGEGRDVSD